MATLTIPKGPRRVRLTAEYYFRLPEGPPYYQLVDGDLIMSPAPHLWKHQSILSYLHIKLGHEILQRGKGILLEAPVDVELDNHNVYQPDLVYVADERRVEEASRVLGAPDLVVEILSPSTRALDLRKKRKIYQQFKVPEIWFLDFDRERLEVLRQEKGEYTSIILSAGDVLETPLLPGYQLALKEVFKGFSRRS